MKEHKIYADMTTLDQSALAQFYDALKQPFAVKGALMADAHKGYSLPIGGVIATKDVIVPAYVGFDIGCGMASIKTNLTKSNFENIDLVKLQQDLYKKIPVGTRVHEIAKTWCGVAHTELATQVLHNRKALFQLGTLGGGNHFLEMGYDENNVIWITVHSGSRGLGHGIATEYMKLASGSDKAKEGHYAFDVNSQEGRDYITDLNYALEFALENRKQMLNSAMDVLTKTLNIKVLTETFINRNHNHAELKDGLWIHRKGATQADKGMCGVIPGNMRDGVFIVKGKGNPDSLNSSSHGAGRVMGRYKAKKVLDVAEFKEQMQGIVASVGKSTLDEAPDAYKNIFDVMEQQKDLVNIIAYVKPILNLKG